MNGIDDFFINGFTLIAEGYKTAGEQGIISKEQAFKCYQIYDFLATCDHEDFYTLFDSSAFNEIAKEYMRLAVRELVEEGTLEEEQGRAVRNRFALLFYEKTAKEVCEG